MEEDRIQELIKKFLNMDNIFAVIGASHDPEKYGHRVYKYLKEAGYKVYPINPNTEEVLGDITYPTLLVLPEKPDVVDFVVPPKVTEEVVKHCKEIGVKKVWMQPDSESEKAIEFCKNNDIDVIYGRCVMVESSKRIKLGERQFN